MKKYFPLIIGISLVLSACNKPKDTQTLVPQVTINKIVYTGQDNNYLPQLFIMNSDGSNATQLTYNTGNHPSVWSKSGMWLADGSKIVFVSNRGGTLNARPEVHIMDADGSNVFQVTHNNRDCVAPIFSPYGDKILYSMGILNVSTGGHQFFMVNLDGTENQQFTFFTRPTARWFKNFVYE